MAEHTKLPRPTAEEIDALFAISERRFSKTLQAA